MGHLLVAFRASKARNRRKGTAVGTAHDELQVAGAYLCHGVVLLISLYPISWFDSFRPLYVAFRGVRISSRFGGKAVRPLGQRELSLSRRSATAPLFARRGESKAL